MIQTRSQPETLVADLAKQAIIARHLEFIGDVKLAWRSELIVHLPDTGRVSMDLCYQFAEPEGDVFGAIECKARWNWELHEQCMRWMAYSSYLWMAFKNPKATTVKRAHRFAPRAGIIVIIDGIAEVVHGATYNEEADTRLVAQAFQSHDGSCDPKAGSASAQRMTKERARWDSLRGWLKAVGASSMSEIRLELPEYRCVTPHQLRKAIDSGEAPGLTYEGFSRTMFKAK